MQVIFCLPIMEEYVQYQRGPFRTIDSALSFVHDLFSCGAYNVSVVFPSGFSFRVVPFGAGLRSYPLGSA